MPDIRVSFKRLALIWAAISALALSGLALTYAWRKAQGFQPNGTFLLAVGIILMGGMAMGIVWHGLHFAPLRLNSFTRWLLTTLARPGLNLLALFYLAQIILGILLLTAWLNLRLFSIAYISQLPLLFWIFFTSLSVFIFLLDINKGNFRGRFCQLRQSLKDALWLLLPTLSAILIGKLADSLTISALGARDSAYSNLPLVRAMSGLGWPLVTFDLFILLPAITPLIRFRFLSDQFLAFRSKLGRSLKPNFFIKRPSFASFITALLLFTVIFAFFRPSYGANDDVFMVAIVSGHMGGQPGPTLIYSNVLLGFFLIPFYQFLGQINWFVVFLLVFQFLSDWCLLNIVYSQRGVPLLRLLAVWIVLGFGAYFLINITFTTTAALCGMTGFCQFAYQIQKRRNHPSLCALVFGGGLIVVGSLIRFDSFVLVLAVTLPLLVVAFSFFQIRKLALVIFVTLIFVAACYSFDRAYILSSPDTQAFDRYDRVRSQLMDTPRLYNGDQVSFNEVGWSQNDAKELRDWAFLDPGVYNAEKFQKLVDRIPDSIGNAFDTLRAFGNIIFQPAILMNLLLFALTIQAVLLFSSQKITAAFVLVVLAIISILSVDLVWKMKLPARVFVSMLAASALFALCSIEWPTALDGKRSPPLPMSDFFRKVVITSLVITFLVSACLSLQQFTETSRTNALLQTTYKKIVHDLNQLVAQGAIQSDSLIVSPTSGFPLEWSNPLTLEFPQSQYLSGGWLVFSPPYQKMLDQFHIQSLPGGFYLNDHVYLMTRSDVVPGIITFIQEHYGVTVTAKTIYTMPANINEYQDVHLYSLNLN